MNHFLKYKNLEKNKIKFLSSKYKQIIINKFLLLELRKSINNNLNNKVTIKMFLIYYLKLKYMNSKHNIHNNFFLTKYKRFCFITKHNRSLKGFKFSRMTFKESILKGNLMGIYKSSW